jgi:hypothetical protein
MINAVRAAIKLFVTASAVCMMSPAQADIITDWNAKAVAIMAAERVTVGVPPARTLAIMHIAMFDAANGSAGRYLPYRSTLPEARGASVEAALHAAARRVLVELYPKQKAAADAHFDAGIAGLPRGQPTEAGIAAGEKAARAILDERKSDGFFGPDEYRPVTAPGVYTGTAPLAMSHVQLAKPFGLRTVSDFRPGPPPSLKSAQWARDYNETRELGGVNSTKRTAWQAETGRFWALSGVIAWNEAARGLCASKPLPVIENARLFALLNIAVTDALLAVFDAKYHYNFWRPLTAIRNGDIDGNDATEREAGWTPLISTPLHPEYPCAHCVIDGAGGVILKTAFGSGKVPEFTLTYEAMPGVTRKYTSIQQLEDEVAMARIWGGVHYRTSNEAGNALGQKVASYVAEQHLRPVR